MLRLRAYIFSPLKDLKVKICEMGEPSPFACLTPSPKKIMIQCLKEEKKHNVFLKLAALSFS